MNSPLMFPALGGFDHRGWMGRIFDESSLALAGLTFSARQGAFARNDRALTLRGLHYQADPHPEARLVCCVRGSLFDVVADVRPDSPAFGVCHTFELSGEDPGVVYVPRGWAHGYLTLEDDTEVYYQIDAPYHLDLQRGIRWDDDVLSIAWPGEPRVISERDRTLPTLRREV